MITHKQCFVACLLRLPLPLLKRVNPALTTLGVCPTPAGVCNLPMGHGRPSHSLAIARCVGIQLHVLSLSFLQAPHHCLS